MTDRLAIAIAQINPTVGDIAGNIALIERFAADAAGLGADLMVAPELSVSGYPPEDLVLKQAFQERIEDAVTALARRLKDAGAPAVLIGAPWRVDGALYNAALLLDDAEIKHIRLKHELPNYGVFDEKRVFQAGPLPGPIPFRDVRLGVMVCEDLWFPDVAECLQESGAEILISERLAVRRQQGRRQAQHRHRAGQRNRPRLALRQSGRRPGRTGLRRWLVRRQPGL
jgi:NAD+ synthase